MKRVLINFLEHIPEILSPFACSSFPNYQIQKNIGETLTKRGDNDDITLNLLETSAISSDGLTYRFSLKKNILFHCGSELTSGDVVATILKVLNVETTATRLQDFLDKNVRNTLLVEEISRYRFEIKLNKRCPDLLYRFSLPEYTVTHKKCGAHCGLWIPEARTDDQLTLRFNEHNFHKLKASYDEVVIKRYSLDDNFNYIISDEAYLFCYPGYQLKSPHYHMAVDSFCNPLKATMGLGLKLPTSNTSHLESITSLLTELLANFFDKKSSYKRTFSQSIVAQDHILHALKTTKPKYTLAEMANPLELSILDKDSQLPPKFFVPLLEKAFSYGLNLSLNNNQEVHKYVQANCAELFWIFSPHPKDYLALLFNLAKHGVISYREQQKSIADAFSLRKSTQLLEITINDPAIFPFITSPIIVRSNRHVEGVLSSDFVPYHLVNASAQSRKEAKRDFETSQAIAAALPMLAHEIKKPFSMMQTVLELIDSTENPEQIHRLISQYVPQLKRQIHNADHLLQDILEIGNTSQLNFDNVSLAEMISTIIMDLTAQGVGKNVDFKGNFAHQHLATCDSHKISLVINNIITNALQALSGQPGTIWYRTEEISTPNSAGQDEPYITCTIGNSGPLIPGEDLTNIFESFYTRGKKGGTGLGLAIVKKVIYGHSGNVWCTSSHESGTEFHFTLPTSLIVDQRIQEFKSERYSIPSPSNNNTEVLYAKSSNSFSCPANELKILIIDDDLVYRQLVETQLLETLGSQVTLTAGSSADDFFKLVDKESFDFALLDIYIDSNLPNGLDLAKHLKKVKNDCFVCLHSSGDPNWLSQKCLEVGADLFIPKPLAINHLNQLTELILKSKGHSHDMTKLIVVDDDPLQLEHWQLLYPDRIRCFHSPKAILAFLKNASPQEHEFQAIILDFVYDHDSVDGIKLAKALREAGIMLPIFIASEVYLEEIPLFVNGQVSKHPQKAVTEIQKLLRPSREV